MKRIQKFFWFCSGASQSILKRCPTEVAKFTGIGATVFFTGIFAILAGSYAIFTVFDNYWAAIGFGILWGAMIFNLDRFIVSSMYTSRQANTWLMAAPRILLAFLIAIVISKPLELKIFEKEIEEELSLIRENLKQEKEQLIRNKYTEDISKLESEIDRLNKEILEKTVSRDELMIIAQQEADGTGGTMKRNAGPIYKIKKADLDRVEEELKALRVQNTPLISEKRLQIYELRKNRETDVKNLGIVQFDGLAARIQALGNLNVKNSNINLANWFVMILFIAIETAPVFVKLLAPKGPYDDILAVHEKTFEIYKEEKITRMVREMNHRLSLQEG